MKHASLSLHDVAGVTVQTTHFEGFSRMRLVITDESGDDFSIDLFTNNANIIIDTLKTDKVTA